MSAFILLGFACIAWGALEIFAGGMSDAPMLGEETSGNGLWWLAGGMIILAGVAVFAIDRWTNS